MAMARRDEYGPRNALNWSEIATLVIRARAIMAAHPPATGFLGAGGERTRRLQQLADDHAITLRTLYRYLRYDPPTKVRVGPWTASFASRDGGAGTPVQVSGWIHDEEAG